MRPTSSQPQRNSREMRRGGGSSGRLNQMDAAAAAASTPPSLHSQASYASAQASTIFPAASPSQPSYFSRTPSPQPFVPAHYALHPSSLSHPVNAPPASSASAQPFSRQHAAPHSQSQSGVGGLQQQQLFISPSLSPPSDGSAYPYPHFPPAQPGGSPSLRQPQRSLHPHAAVSSSSSSSPPAAFAPSFTAYHPRTPPPHPGPISPPSSLPAPPQPASSASSFSRLSHNPKHGSSLHSPLSSFSQPALHRAEPLTPSSAHSSDSSRPDDDNDELLDAAALKAAKLSKATSASVSAEVDSLRRTIDHLHRLQLGFVLKEQAMERQITDLQRQLERQSRPAQRSAAAATASASAPSLLLSPSASSARPASASSSPLPPLPASSSLPPALIVHISSLLSSLSPSRHSEQRRIAVLSWLKALIRKSLGAQCYPISSFALKTYLQSEAMTVSAFFSRAHEPSWLQRVVNALCQEAYATSSSSGSGAGGGLAGSSDVAGGDVAVPTASALYLVQSVTVYFATSKQHAVVSCCIGGVDVCVYGNNIPALASLALFEHVDSCLVQREHLFKRSVLLLKLWAAAHGLYGGQEQAVLLSGLFLRTLMLFTFNRFHSQLQTPLDALLCLLRFLATFDWDQAALSVYGPVLLSSLDSPRLEAVSDGEMAWPADLQPLLPTSVVHSYQMQSGREAAAGMATGGAAAAGAGSAGDGRVAAVKPGLGRHSGSAGSLPRVNSSMFLELPADDVSAAVGRSNSDTNLTSLGIKSASSSSLSSLQSTAPPLPPAVYEVSGSGDRFTPLHNVRGLRSSPDSPSSAFRSKSYTSLTSLDFTPDHSPLPALSSSYQPPPHHKEAAQQRQTQTPASITSTSASSSASSLSSFSSSAAATSSYYSQLPFPPTIPADSSFHPSPPFPIHPNAAEPDNEFPASDASDAEDDALSDYVDSDTESSAPPVSSSPAAAASFSASPLELYATDRQTAAAVCSLNVLDAVERGKNLGVNVAYKYQYRIRSLLADGYSRLVQAIHKVKEREAAAAAAAAGDADAAAADGDVEEDELLRELFDRETLSEYKERLYREHKAKTGSAAALSPTAAAATQQQDVKEATADAEQKAAKTELPEKAAAPAKSQSSLNPNSSEFIPASLWPLDTSSSSPSSSSLHPSASSPSLLSPTSFDPLDGNLAKVLTNLSHARQFEVPAISEAQLLALLVSILQERGAVAVGRLGSLMHDRTNNHSLPAALKESYGGLKRLLERHPDLFQLGTDHPYNPHVRLKARAGAETGVPVAAAVVAAASGGKRKPQRRRTRVRRVNNNRGSNTNLAAMSSASSTAASSSSASTAGFSSSPSRPALTGCLAIDCEMIGVGSGGLSSILARVSVVNANLETVYDSFCSPTETVTDYRTAVSGITPAHLAAAPSFSSVQREVAAIIKGRVLVGHGLAGDLQVLCLSHPRYLLRDTAHCKLLCPVRPIGLKRLMRERLGVEVQEAEHDSVEDARSAMLLYLSVQAEWELSMEHSLSLQTPITEQQTTVYHIL